MGLLTILKKVKEEEREIRLLVLGLDNAGKTSLVKRFILGDDTDMDQIEPTLGFSIQTLEYCLQQNSYDDEDSNGSGNGGEGGIAVNDVGKQQPQQQQTQPSSSSSSNTGELYRLHLWDIGGQSSIRAYWRNYFEKTDGVVFVVDSGDAHRLDLVKQELASLLQQERLAGATLLVLANKQDLANALSPQQIAAALELNNIQYSNRHWAIYGCSAVVVSGSGDLAKAMQWLVQDITSRIFLLN